MTGAAVPFLERHVTDRIEQPLVRTAVSIVAGDAGRGSRPDAVMGLQEGLAARVMTLTAELTAGFCEHAFFPGTMGTVAQQTILEGGPVRHPFAPVFGHVGMAGQAEHGLPLFQNILPRGAVGRVTTHAVPVDGRPMIEGVPVHGLLDFLMTIQAEGAGRLFEHRGVISGMGGMAFPALSIDNRLMPGAVCRRFLHGLVTGQAEGSPLVFRFEETGGRRLMHFVTTAAIPLGKRAMQAEHAPLIRRLPVAGKTKFGLRGAQQ